MRDILQQGFRRLLKKVLKPGDIVQIVFEGNQFRLSKNLDDHYYYGNNIFAYHGDKCLVVDCFESYHDKRFLEPRVAVKLWLFKQQIVAYDSCGSANETMYFTTYYKKII